MIIVEKELKHSGLWDTFQGLGSRLSEKIKCLQSFQLLGQGITTLSSES